MAPLPPLASSQADPCLLPRYDRAATGPLAESLRNAKNPAPNRYSKSAEQSLTVKISAGRTKFGTSVREGPEGNIKMKTPAPGTYGTTPNPLLNWRVTFDTETDICVGCAQAPQIWTNSRRATDAQR